MKGVFVRPLRVGDAELVDAWRRRYLKGDLEFPHGLQMDGVETVMAMKDHAPIASLTGIRSVVYDPFTHNPDASDSDLLYALVKLETVLSYEAQRVGAVDAYIAVPNSEAKYARLLENYGFLPTVQNCIVMRRPLVPDHIPLLGAERDAAERADAATKEAKRAARRARREANVAARDTSSAH